MSRNYDNFADLITFSRASQSTVVDSDGTLKYAAHNLVPYSEQIDQWSANATTITANATTAPDGTNTAESMDLVANSSRITRGLSLPESTYTIAAFIKTDTVTAMRFRLRGAVSTTLHDQTVTITADNEWHLVTAEISPGEDIDQIQIRAASSPFGLIYIWGVHLYQSDKPMQNNPAQSDTNLATYVPTTDAAVYQPRIDFDAVTGDRKGLLIEEARTNNAQNSEDAEKLFLMQGVTLTANDTTAPDGTNTADKIEITASSGNRRIFTRHYFDSPVQITSVTHTSGVTASIFIKAGSLTGNTLTLQFWDNANGSVKLGANFTLESSGSVEITNDTAGGGNATIQKFPNGWYRLSIFSLETVDLKSFKINNKPQGNFYYVWGLQVETDATFPTSYIPTSGSTVTRSADVASIATSAFGYNQDESTYLISVTPNNEEEVTKYAFVADGALRFPQGTSQIRWYSGESGSSAKIDNVVSGKTYNIAISMDDANNDSISSNGEAIISGGGTSSLSDDISTVYIGSNSSSTQQFNGHIKKLQYFPRRLSDTELQEITS